MVSAIQRQGTLVIERTLEDDVEVIELSVPAVLCVTSAILTCHAFFDESFSFSARVKPVTSGRQVILTEPERAITC